MPPAPSRPKRGRLRDRGDGPMLITVTFRHVDPTPPLKAYAEEKLQRVRKYLHRPVDAQVIRTQRVPAKPLAVEEAVEQLAVSGDEFLVFTNASNQRVAVLYRRRDGNFGLIEPERR